MLTPSFSRRLPGILAITVVLGAGTFLYAQMGPDDDRLIPYAGTLERDGSGANGLHDFRFALFTVMPDATALDCLLAEPASCPLYNETHAGVNVANGAFSVVLGEDAPITDTMLAQDALYIGIAVRADGDVAYTKLVGSTRLLPTPWASRTAEQHDFRVVGDITAGGRLRADCPAGMIRIVPNSAVCIDTGVFDVGTLNWYDSSTQCQNEGKRLCSASEANVGIRANAALQLDFNTADRWVWVDAVDDDSGAQDFKGCHANLNTNQPGTYLGEMNCQVGAAQAVFPIGRKCCFSQ